MKLALWLMGRFGVDPSLTGDLKEEWARGRSPVWLLRQTLVAIGATAFAGLWEHKLLTFRALLLGWALAEGGAVLVRMVSTPADGILVPISFLAIVGWTVARAHGEQPMGAAVLFMGTFALRAAFVAWLYSSRHAHLSSVLLSGFLQEQSVLLPSILAGALLAGRRYRLLGVTL